MLKVYNSLGKQLEIFKPANKKVVNIFTCGPSVYQRAHIGNFRTFLFEDVLVRYLRYSGFAVRRGMNFTDIEDKAIAEAGKSNRSVAGLTTDNIGRFLEEMKLLRISMPEYLPRASEHVDDAVDIIQSLLQKGIAYRHGGNIYFDPLRFPGFGKLYGLDMSGWPGKKRRFHKDTYPGTQWNLGDFILWHGYRRGDADYWETKIGKGRPSWNIQDPSMIRGHFDETLSVYCGGIDNLFRHHDYTIAILESIRPYPVSSYWLHCNHLYVQGRKMSKSRGNVYYTDTLLKQGYAAAEARFVLICTHYRSKLHFSDKAMRSAADKLRELRRTVGLIRRRTGRSGAVESGISRRIAQAFREGMDNDLNVQAAVDGMYALLSGIVPSELSAGDAAGVVKILRETDEVLRVIF